MIWTIYNSNDEPLYDVDLDGLRWFLWSGDQTLHVRILEPIVDWLVLKVR